MAKYSQELVGTPAIELLESPSSWLCRLALSQGATMRELTSYLKLPPVRNLDLDLVFTQINARRLAIACGQDRRSITLTQLMMKRLRRIDLHGREYLLFENKKPRYRFCPQCLYEQRTKHYPLHWRFKAWRCCWIHNCLLSSECPHCLSPIRLPVDMLYAGPEKAGIASLAFCLVCGGSLTTGRESSIGTLCDETLTPFELTLLKNGRALLASLFTNEVWFSELKLKLGKAAIRRIEKQGLLPHDHFKLDDFEMRRRYRVYLTLEAAKISPPHSSNES